MKINIAYAPDDKYINQTVVSMTSAVENNQKHEIEFIIVYSNLSNKNIEKLKAVPNCKIRLLQVDENMFKGLPIAHWLTVQAWFRTKLPDLCPDINKLLYLDCDTLILGDLEELFSTDMEGKFIAGVKDVWGVDKYVKRLAMKSNVYINTGMLLVNAEYCRKKDFFNKIVDFATHNPKIIEFSDQDAVNKIADENKLVLHPKFNYMDTWWKGGYYEFEGKEEQDYLDAGKKPIVVHLTGLKPAFKGCKNKFKDKWWEYAKLTNIYQELISDYEKSKIPKEPFKDKIFSIKNKYQQKIKIKILTILGIKIILKKKSF